jgi:hypothetical protein
MHLAPLTCILSFYIIITIEFLFVTVEKSVRGVRKTLMSDVDVCLIWRFRVHERGLKDRQKRQLLRLSLANSGTACEHDLTS